MTYHAMTLLIQLIFLLLSALALGAAVMVVTVRNLIHAALWLIASFFAVAGLYVLMQAEFVGVVQVLIYVGAVSILALFAIMLTRHVTGEGERHLYRSWWVALVVAAALFGLLIVPAVTGTTWATVPPPAAGQPQTVAGAREIGIAFMREYLLPFEAASLLLLAALIGAIVIAFEERGVRRRVLTLAEDLALRRQQPAVREQQPEADGRPAPEGVPAVGAAPTVQNIGDS